MVFKRPMHLIMALEGPNGCVTVVIKPARPNALIFQLWLSRPYSHSTFAAGAFPFMPDNFGRQTLSFQALPAKRKAAEVALRCFPALYPPPGTSPNLLEEPQTALRLMARPMPTAMPFHAPSGAAFPACEIKSLTRSSPSTSAHHAELECREKPRMTISDSQFVS